MPEINPEILVLARESRGLSQAELAEAIGVAQGKISKYEHGFLDVSPEDLRAIARGLSYEPEFFYQRDKIYTLGSSFIFHRQRKATPARVQKRMEAYSNVLRIQLERLTRAVEITPALSFQQMNLDSYSGDPTLVAQCVRRAWSLPNGPIDNLTALIESAGGMVLSFDFGTEKIDGLHMTVSGMPPLFFINSLVPADRYRFSLAHELGHAIMHAVPRPGEIEKEADAFAAELLMPADAIGSQLVGLTLDRAAILKKRWKVAMQALIRRAYELGKIGERRYRNLFVTLSAAGYRKLEPFPLEREEPRTVRQLVDVHQKELGYSWEDLVKLLFCRDPQFIPVDVPPGSANLRVLRFPTGA